MFHNNVINNYLNLDCVTFCEDMIQSVRHWVDIKSNEPIVQRHLEAMMSLRYDGLESIIKGRKIPVIM